MVGAGHLACFWSMTLREKQIPDSWKPFAMHVGMRTDHPGFLLEGMPIGSQTNALGGASSFLMLHGPLNIILRVDLHLARCLYGLIRVVFSIYPCFCLAISNWFG